MDEEKKREVYCPVEREKRKNHKEIERVCRELGLVNEGYKFEYEKAEFRSYDRKKGLHKIILLETICKKIKKVIEKGVYDFSYVVFDGDVDFSGYTFKERVDFSYSIFKAEADYQCAIFEKDVTFRIAIFYEYTTFLEATFKENANFFSSKFKVHVTFRDSIFKAEAQFITTIFSTTTCFEFKKVKYLIFKNIRYIFGNEFLMMEEEYYDNIINGSRQTFRLLKHIALERHNKILANKLLKREMEVYHKELKESGKNFGDRFILFFNKWSNNYGLSWWRGIVFTVTTTMLFYFLSQTAKYDFIFIGMKGFSFNLWWSFLCEYLNSLTDIEFFNPSNISCTIDSFIEIKKFNPIEILCNNGYSLLEKFFLLIEKIFLVLGIFRINQAFKKLNDKG